MARSSVQEVLIPPDDEALAPPLTASAIAPLSSPLLDPTLSPLTHAQAYYWRELCGAVRACGAAGMPDVGWPPELAPSKPTFKALVAYGLLVRRGRAWHLRRSWYARLTALHAVATPMLAPAERPGPNLPSYAELEQWETLCRWLDSQPHRRARLPFVGLAVFIAQPGIPASAAADHGALGEAPIVQLQAMRRYRLVRHTWACEWALSPTWKVRLTDLWQGIARTYRERFVSQTPSSDPRVLAAGIDTWYLNRLEADALPARLRRRLDELQARANEEDDEIDTPWGFDGVPLRMYRAGVNTRQGGGVSWSYILRNASLTLLIRKHPLGQVVAQARLGSECLWRLTARRALDELDTVVKRMWGKTTGTWQVSQVHLAVDVAHAPIEAEQLTRYVSRSRRQAIYEAARRDVERLTRDLYGDGEADEEGLFTVDWDAQYADQSDALMGWDAAVGCEGERHEDEPELIEDRAVTVYRVHRQFSGVTWSPGGAISLVQYDKRLQAVVSGKRHMEPIWQSSAGGWQPEEGATRFEARLRRDALRELGLPTQLRSCLDDPWEFLRHTQDVFAAVVGRLDECPDAVNTAWIRLVVPDARDSNRSRWPTDPLWRVVQAAPFSPAPVAARRLIRHRRQVHDVARLDSGVYGYLVSRVAHLHPNGGQYDISAAIGEAQRALVKEAAKPGKDFGELVRARRRRFGLPNPPAEKVLVFRRSAASATLGETPEHEVFAAAGEHSLPDERDVWGHADKRRLLLLRSAERRMEQALQALDAAQLRGAARRVLAQLEAAYACEEAAYRAVHAQMGEGASTASSSGSVTDINKRD
jgi:hypothetical protein